MDRSCTKPVAPATPGATVLRRWTLLAAALAALAIAVVVAGPAGAERAESGDLIVSLDGGITPIKLPRDRQAPVAVRLAGGSAPSITRRCPASKGSSSPSPTAANSSPEACPSVLAHG